MMRSPEGKALDYIREHLSQGAVIKATDPKGRILELLPDGSWHGGLTIEYPQEESS